MVVQTEVYAHLNVNWSTTDLTQAYTQIKQWYSQKYMLILILLKEYHHLNKDRDTNKGFFQIKKRCKECNKTL